MILFPRRMFYIEAALWLVVAAASFAAGYFIGRGSGSHGPPSGQDELARDRFPVEGRVTYDAENGSGQADEGAVVVLLPVGKPPASRPSAEGLAPSDPVPADDAPVVRAIQKMGGAYARADRSGYFMVYLPQRGNYYALVVSRHATRSQETPTEEEDMAKLAEYLDQANRLIRGRQYRWSEEELALGRGPLDVNFPGAAEPPAQPK
jgi:hypothetical protein